MVSYGTRSVVLICKMQKALKMHRCEFSLSENLSEQTLRKARKHTRQVSNNVVETFKAGLGYKKNNPKL